MFIACMLWLFVRSFICIVFVFSPILQFFSSFVRYFSIKKFALFQYASVACVLVRSFQRLANNLSAFVHCASQLLAFLPGFHSSPAGIRTRALCAHTLESELVLLRSLSTSRYYSLPSRKLLRQQNFLPPFHFRSISAHQATFTRANLQQSC